ncbi:MAG: nitroreductase family protein [Candidatus Coatesbacteria bacterium]|nr:nitroreductase family protein [Candidatus Coatesbacteria bacterium]
MEVYEAIKTRQSVRAYKPDKVDKNVLMRVLEAARLAPSASNRQEWRFVVVTDDELRQKMMEVASNQKFVGHAPVVIACCAKTDGYLMRCGQQCYPIDVAIAIDHITLAAVAEGLGTCWIGSFYEDKAKALLGIPKGIRVVELLTLGYPAEAPRDKTRLAMKEIVCWEKWAL